MHAHVDIIHVHVAVHIELFMDLKATLVSTNNVMDVNVHFYLRFAPPWPSK